MPRALDSSISSSLVQVARRIIVGRNKCFVSPFEASRPLLLSKRTFKLSIQSRRDRQSPTFIKSNTPFLNCSMASAGSNELRQWQQTLPTSRSLSFSIPYKMPRNASRRVWRRLNAEEELLEARRNPHKKPLWARLIKEQHPPDS